MATWTITQTERTLKGSKGDDQIYRLYWQCFGSETVDGVIHEGRCNGSINIPEPSGSFIAYASVTHENCITWCKAIMGADEVKTAEDNVEKIISTKKTPVTATGVPW
jgi:hypothetical protein|tara:strand:- start:18 stop:338 length:321 start_codon:yes stop_codon:yes gene_type:complete